ncbi:hypothetical protein SVIOM342S_00362 [Streptomyces violaceorubidus]
MLEQERTYPNDYGPLSVHTGIPWGYRTNAEQILAYLREQCALIVGPTGSGKTNMVHSILAGFARADDILTWVIDLNAGSAGLPWVLPALNGEIDAGDGKPVRPGIDWLAGTYDEAMTLPDVAVRVAKQRKMGYQDVLARANTTRCLSAPGFRRSCWSSTRARRSWPAPTGTCANSARRSWKRSGSPAPWASAPS